ncbi:MAG: antibiotic biosynthesis monooxygenase [Acidimicrobiales bacterium]
MYGLVVRFELLEGHEEAFDALALRTLRSIEAEEPRTAVYLSHRLHESPGVRVFYELYDDIDAFDAHERAVHVQRFLEERGQHLRGDPEVWVAEPTGGFVREPRLPGVAQP